MKTVMLMYLAEDQRCVDRLLEEQAVAVHSRLPIEGHGPGGTGWYGEVAPYDSRMALAVVEDAVADRLLDAVRECRGVADPAHPLRAVQIDVEDVASCLCEPTGEKTATSTEE